MNLALKKPRDVPPRGFLYREAATGWTVTDPNQPIGRVTREVQKHRANNPTLGLDTDYEACEQAVLMQLCKRLPSECYDPNDPALPPPEPAKKRKCCGQK